MARACPGCRCSPGRRCSTRWSRPFSTRPASCAGPAANFLRSRTCTTRSVPKPTPSACKRMLRILTAPTGNGFGFGVAAGVIAAQGTRTPREYLDYLIGLTHVSASELGLRYRLDLTRPDTALSSPVQENIATLQGFFRDSFQC